MTVVGTCSRGYGEDPYTNGVFCVASVKGYQGDTLADERRVYPCLKHYGYGASEAGRDDYMFIRNFQTDALGYLYASYEMGVKAGAVTLMSAFNDISGVPASANRYTMTEILKNRWKHDGFVVSDWEQWNSW